LRAIGIQPDILLCRTSHELPSDLKAKIALFTNVPIEAVITAMDASSIYEIPLNFAGERLDTIILRKLGLDSAQPDLSRWQKLVETAYHPRDEVTIAIVGKYTGLRDSYLSLYQALDHGGVGNSLRVNLNWIEAEELEKEAYLRRLKDQDGILVPGGFGQRGVEGKIKAVKYARVKEGSVLWHLFGHAVCNHRICPKCCSPEKGSQPRIRSSPVLTLFFASGRSFSQTLTWAEQ